MKPRFFHIGNITLPSALALGMLGVILFSSSHVLFSQSNSYEVKLHNDSASFTVLEIPTLYVEGWDTLSQIQFWREIIRMQQDSALVSIAKNREVLSRIYSPDYDSLPSRKDKVVFKDSIRGAKNVRSDELIYVTSGKSHYYLLREVLPQIDRSIEIFQEEGVDPLYAQAILLIESPAKLRTSHTGAYGPFQLMKSVAIAEGLVVNDSVDEREDFDKATRAAAKFIKTTCIPNARSMVRTRGYKVKESDMWFKLFVLHVYHAGARTVRKAFYTIPASKRRKELIQSLWTTRYGRFGNASQNYSQIAIASLFELDRIITEEFEYICEDEPNATSQGGR